jgi:hypothetical protein
MLWFITFYCTLHMQGLWSFSFLGCSSWLLLCRLQVWWSMWGPTIGFLKGDVSNSIQLPVQYGYRQRNVIQDARLRHFIRDVVFTVLHSWRWNDRANQKFTKKTFEISKWIVLSETRYTVSVFDVKRLNSSLSRFELPIRLQVRGVFEFNAWLLRIPNSPSYIHGWTYISWYSTQPSCFVSYFVLSIDQTYIRERSLWG